MLTPGNAAAKRISLPLVTFSGPDGVNGDEEVVDDDNDDDDSGDTGGLDGDSPLSSGKNISLAQVSSN